MVKAWTEDVVIPTYEIGEPEKNPIFLEKRVYQGSSGVVYPYPVVESISDQKTDHTYHAVYLENEYIKVMVLPELGGRIQMAYDKVRQRHFIYYNHVIKPALVGLAGPWISGGIEFNWPQHHRPSTFMPVDFTIDDTATDGSVTVWVNERERMFHQQGRAGFTLRPDCAYLEVRGRLYNPTSMPQTFLWWANPAVSVNDQYQSVFPPDVNAVFDHGKRAVSTFPIATGTYYKMDYSAGVDISNYKNIFVPTSYMVAASKYDFEGGYENDTQAGMLHVADHHFSPGKKQWTWGNGDFGRAWDNNLTDDDGPYIELMAGVYTENQPDFSWLMPYEEKQFTQYFLPYRELGVVKNATRNLLLNLTPSSADTARLQVFATSTLRVSIELTDRQGHVYIDREETLSPRQIFDVTVPVTSFADLHVALYIDQRLELEYEAEPDEVRPIPDAAQPAQLPHEIRTNEELFLTGLHLEQYRHATYSPFDYYEEALRRDPLDVRCNNALGLLYIRKGRFDLAEGYLRTAVRVLQRHNPNPYDGEPLYNLGLCLKLLGRLDEAYEWFYKSTWNAAWQAAGYLACAQISTQRRNFAQALYEVEQALLRGWHNHKARALKATLLRLSGRCEEALQWISDSLQINLFNYGCMYEQYSITDDPTVLRKMLSLMHADANNYDELALDYCEAGCWLEAAEIWLHAEQQQATTALTFYYRAWAESHYAPCESEDTLCMAADMSPDYCFPNCNEAILALNWAKDQNPSDAHPWHFLGNLYYDRRQYDLAQQHWEQAADLCPDFPTTWRNLALVYANKRGDTERALQCMQKAFSLDTTDSRVLMELDQLYKRMQYSPDFRLSNLQQYPEAIARRDDLVLEQITLLNQLGRHAEAKAMIDAHVFHPWEGGEGKVSSQYQIARLELARQLIFDQSNRNEEHLLQAISLLNECLVLPRTLGEGKLYGAQDNDFHYYLGIAYHLLGDEAKATEEWTLGTVGPTEPAPALYYNDAKPDKIFFAALCHRALGHEQQALSLFHKLVSYGEQHLFDQVRMDYFAVSLPDLLIWEDSLDLRNQIHCKYLLALGHYGLGNHQKSRRYLCEVIALDINHQGAQSLQRFAQQ